MFARRDERVTIERGLLVEEDDRCAILVDDMVSIRPARDHFANKTWSRLKSPHVGLHVKLLTLRHFGIGQESRL